MKSDDWDRLDEHEVRKDHDVYGFQVVETTGYDDREHMVESLSGDIDRMIAFAERKKDEPYTAHDWRKMKFILIALVPRDGSSVFEGIVPDDEEP
jgi:hypothetical protein